jgi:predicted MFS family arabinose efflux permease
MDWNYRRWAKKLNLPLEKKRSMDLRNFPIEKARLETLFFLVPIGVATYIPFGWVLQKRVHLAVPLVLEFVTGFCMVAMSNTLSSLLVDLFPENPATASAASNSVRCWSAGAMTAAISYMLSGMGWGWCFTFLGLLLLIGLPLVWIEMTWGMGWREERRVREEQKRASHDARGK